MVRSRKGISRVPTLCSPCWRVILPENVPACVGVRVICTVLLSPGPMVSVDGSIVMPSGAVYPVISRGPAPVFSILDSTVFGLPHFKGCAEVNLSGEEGNNGRFVE